MRSLLTAIFAINIFVHLAFSQEQKSYDDDVEELLLLMNYDIQVSRLTDVILEMQLKQNPDVIPLRDTIRAFVLKILRWENLKSDLIHIFKETFTKDEIKQLISFYKTPIGQKLLQKMPKISTQMYSLSKRIFEENREELERMLTKAMTTGEAKPGSATSESTTEYDEDMTATYLEDAVAEIDRRTLLESEPNFRDLGGYQTSDGRTVKWGMLYRSGTLTELGEQDLARLRKLGIKTIVDLRFMSETRSEGAHPLNQTARVIRLPIERVDITEPFLKAVDAGDFSLIPPTLIAQYNRKFVREWTHQFSALLWIISDSTNLPLVFHCDDGRDRTGIASAIILSVLGVPRETVMKDYLLSNICLEERNEKQLEEIRATSADMFGQTPARIDLSNLEAVLYVKPLYLEAAQDEIMRIFGSMEKFISYGLGFSDEQIHRLRDTLLD